MNSRGKMDGERSLREQENQTSATPRFSQMARCVPSLANTPVLSPKRESQMLLQWDGKILLSRNGGRQKSTDSFERLTTTS
jgi:hypothetical protein